MSDGERLLDDGPLLSFADGLLLMLSSSRLKRFRFLGDDVRDL